MLNAECAAQDPAGRHGGLHYAAHGFPVGSPLAELGLPRTRRVASSYQYFAQPMDKLNVSSPSPVKARKKTVGTDMDAVDIFAEAAAPVGVMTRVFGNEFAPYLS